VARSRLVILFETQRFPALVTRSRFEAQLWHGKDFCVAAGAPLLARAASMDTDFQLIAT
jgi:hypothetical protein